MSAPVVIEAAINGGTPKSRNPNSRRSVEEIAADAVRADADVRGPRLPEVTLRQHARTVQYSCHHADCEDGVRDWIEADDDS